MCDKLIFQIHAMVNMIFVEKKSYFFIFGDALDNNMVRYDRIGAYFNKIMYQALETAQHSQHIVMRRSVL
jgi:hypothetical protein